MGNRFHRTAYIAEGRDAIRRAVVACANDKRRVLGQSGTMCLVLDQRDHHPNTRKSS